VTSFVTAAITGRVWIFGQAGNDNFTASTARRPSSSAAPAATPDRRQRRDILIGGAASTSCGGGGDDILIGGTTSFDTNPPALDTIMAEWTSAQLSDRIDRIIGIAAGGTTRLLLKVSGTGKGSLPTRSWATCPSINCSAKPANWFWFTSLGSFIDEMKDITTGQVATALPQ
jgi:hypothetical protein